ncbi:MAG: hypothetical protein HDT43_10075 [Ruminococcaceae bacterium]|nr:hypothetical protein [Oscillospiraceae bacterium]
MKPKKVISKLLFAASGALLLAFAVKTAADHNSYTQTVNGAPFMLRIAVNSLCFITPAAVIFSAALYIRRWAKALLGVTLTFAALTALIVSVMWKNASADSLLYGMPFAIPALTGGILTVLCRHKTKS